MNLLESIIILLLLIIIGGIVFVIYLLRNMPECRSCEPHNYYSHRYPTGGEYRSVARRLERTNDELAVLLNTVDKNAERLHQLEKMSRRIKDITRDYLFTSENLEFTGGIATQFSPFISTVVNLIFIELLYKDMEPQKAAMLLGNTLKKMENKYKDFDEFKKKPFIITAEILCELMNFLGPKPNICPICGRSL